MNTRHPQSKRFNLRHALMTLIVIAWCGIIFYAVGVLKADAGVGVNGGGVTVTGGGPLGGAVTLTNDQNVFSANRLFSGGLVGQWDFSEGRGQWAYNRATKQPQPMLSFGNPAINYFGDGLAYVPDVYTGGNTTNAITNASSKLYGNTGVQPYTGGLYQDPLGGYAASYVVVNATQPLATYQNATELINPADTLTFSVWVKTANGTNDTFKMQYSTNDANGGSFVTSPTFTATPNWQRFVWTTNAIPASVKGVWQIIYPMGATATIYCYVWGAQAEVQDTPTLNPDYRFDWQLGMSGSSNKYSPQWTTNGLYFSNTMAQAFGENPIRLKKFTMYQVVRRTLDANSTNLYGSQQQLWKDGRGAYDTDLFGFMFGAGYVDAAAATYFGGQANAAQSQDCSLADGNWHIVVSTYDGAGVSLFFDDVLINSNRLNTLNQQDLYRLQIGSGSIYGGIGSAFEGDIAYMALYDVAHSISQVQQNELSIRNILAQRGIATGIAKPLVLFEGDSITAPGPPAGNTGTVKLTNRWHFRGIFGLTNSPKFIAANYAVGGSTITNSGAGPAVTNNMYARLPIVMAQYNPNRLNVIDIYIGINDIPGFSAPTVFTNLLQYSTNLQAQGWKIICSTIYASPAVPEATRVAYNALLRANTPKVWDYLNDWGADAIIGQAAVTNNATYFDAGNVHIKDPGHVIMGRYAQTNLAAALGSAISGLYP